MATPPSVCSSPSCLLRPVYLRSHCWNHLSEESQASYASDLVVDVTQRRALSGENFRSVVLCDVAFPERIALRDCDFSQARLEQCSLVRADLQGSTFVGATVKGCHLENADCRGITTSFRGANLRETHFDGALLQNVDLTDAKLEDAILIGADLIGAKLRGARLYAARFGGARLRMASLCNFLPRHPSRIRIADEYGEEGRPTPLWARFVYTELMNNFRSIGDYEDERWAHIMERLMERKRLFRLGFLGDRTADALALEHWAQEERAALYESRIVAAARWVLAWLPWLVGYGESVSRIVLLSIAIVVVCAAAFVPSGMTATQAAYVSLISFTTLGYVPGTVMSRLSPDSGLWLALGIEAFIGAVMMALLVVVLGRRLIRG